MEVVLWSGDIDFIVGVVCEYDEEVDIIIEILFEDKLFVIVRWDYLFMI